MTSSARVLGLRALPDTLPGRTETVELWPFSQGEIDGLDEGFVDSAFTDAGALNHTSAVRRAEYAERIVRGGFPEAVARANLARRERFFDSYVADLVARRQPAVGDRTAGAAARLAAAARGPLRAAPGRQCAEQRSPALCADGPPLPEPARGSLLDQADARVVAQRVRPRDRHPKVAFVDSGVAQPAAAWRPVRAFAGGLRPDGVGSPADLVAAADRAVPLPTKDGTEVDAVLEDRQGRVVGIEVKASSTVRSEDFRGLRHLADRLGEDFVAGFVLYTGTQTLPFGPRLRAVPASALWEIADRNGSTDHA